VKIDIEGHELRAFEEFGNYLDKEFINFIQFEYGGANLDSPTSLLELFDFLETRDFALYKIMSNYLEPRSWNPYMNSFVYANYIAISKNILGELNKC
jgi:hypothetical protein